VTYRASGIHDLAAAMQPSDVAAAMDLPPAISVDALLDTAKAG
jgi:hypothetical protein